MCCGGLYLDTTTGNIVKVFFPIPNARIPVIDMQGSYSICQWGQREKDKEFVPELPVTGWARMESLQKDYWLKHEPKKVFIPFKSFYEKDREDPTYPKNKATEFKLEEEQGLLGLLIKHNEKEYAYPITRHRDNWVHNRFPVILSSKSALNS